MRYIVALCVFLASVASGFAQQAGTVSNMPYAGQPLNGSEFLYIVQSGISKKVTVSQLIASSIISLNNIWTGTNTFNGLVTVNGGLTASVIDPTVPGWGAPFGIPPIGPPLNPLLSLNAIYVNTTVDGAATGYSNGFTLNSIINTGYCWSVAGAPIPPTGINCSVPTYVNFQGSLLVNYGSGNDYWGNLGIIDMRANAGGQATAGIVKGTFTGEPLLAALRGQAENYSGRVAYGLIISSSQIDGSDNPFDNSVDYGVFVHQSHTYGVVVGGEEGAVGAVLPTFPYAFVNTDSSAIRWGIANESNGGYAIEFISGQLQIFSYGAGTYPSILEENLNGGVDSKNWIQSIDTSGDWTLAAANDALSGSSTALQITRTGSTPTSLIASVNVEPVIDNTYALGSTGAHWSTVYANLYVSNGGAAGVTCSGSPTSSFTSVFGIVTHC